jgi:predicted CDP-diglyceride synthetase/phosphatidate cytidylyltransferase
VGFVLLDLKFYDFFLIIVCPFVLFLLNIVLSVLRLTDSDFLFDVFKLFYNTVWETTARQLAKCECKMILASTFVFDKKVMI